MQAGPDGASRLCARSRRSISICACSTKRPDGFHELRTVFQTISLADTIDIEYEPARRTEISIDDPLAIPGQSGAARRTRGTGCDEASHARVHFRLEEDASRWAADLGGGSSNAAAVLLALPVLAGRRSAMEQLAEIARRAGQRCAFFPYRRHGHRHRPGHRSSILCRICSPEPILMVSPGLHVATGPAYQALGRSLTFTRFVK